MLIIRGGSRSGGVPSGPPSIDGHWIQSGSWQNKDSTWFNGMSTFTKDQFNCVIFRYHWGTEIETSAGSGSSSGAFDWSLTDDSANAAEAAGMPFKFVLNWRHFDTAKGDILPPDLVSDYQYTKSDGYCSPMFVPLVRERYQKMVTALIDRYASYTYFYGIQTTETAGMETVGSYTYDQTTYEDELNTLFTNIANHNTNIWCDFGWNFINGAFNTADSATAFNRVFSGVPTINVKLFTPDIIRADSDNDNNFAALDERVYPLFHQSYDGSTTCLINNYDCGSSMQFTSYTLPGANDTMNNGGYDMDELFTWGRDTLLIPFCIWTYQNSRNYTFDSPRTGVTYGDAVGVARLAWGHSYDANYAG